ncbi:MAG TPA: tripartite tricarboxylate transporter substrate binding protein [Ramlibacter sp.]
MIRRLLLTIGLAALALAGLPGDSAQAQEKYPSHPVSLVVPFPPGGVADIVARALAPAMEKRLGQPVVIVNKPGAGGAVGTGVVAASKPDGYTLLVALASISTNPEQERLNKRPPPFQLNQLAPVARLSMEEMMLAVRADSGYRKVADVVEDARRRPGQVSYASSGMYGVYHVAMSMFTNAAGISMNHVPYNGGPPALLALLAGEVDVALVTRSVGAAHLKAGKLRPLAAWGSRKWADYPDVPTIQGEGFDVDYQLWSGMFAPAGTPQEVMATVREAVRAAVQDPQFIATLERQGATPAYLDAPQFQLYWEQDAKRLISAMQKIGPVN